MTNKGDRYDVKAINTSVLDDSVQEPQKIENHEHFKSAAFKTDAANKEISNDVQESGLQECECECNSLEADSDNNKVVNGKKDSHNCAAPINDVKGRDVADLEGGGANAIFPGSNTIATDTAPKKVGKLAEIFDLHEDDVMEYIKIPPHNKKDFHRTAEQLQVASNDYYPRFSGINTENTDVCIYMSVGIGLGLIIGCGLILKMAGVL